MNILENHREHFWEVNDEFLPPKNGYVTGQGTGARAFKEGKCCPVPAELLLVIYSPLDIESSFKEIFFNTGGWT